MARVDRRRRPTSEGYRRVASFRIDNESTGHYSFSNTVNTIWDPFAGLSNDQQRLLGIYERLLAERNKSVNLISRASIDDVHDRHIVHSLTMAIREFPEGSSVVDWGTGGGLPGMPLAIRFPNVTFYLVDSVQKKVRALERIRRELGLKNVVVHAVRAEEWSTPVDYAISRATASLATLWEWTEPVLKQEQPTGSGSWPPGLLALKGGDVRGEIAGLSQLRADTVVEQVSLEEVTGDVGLREKYVVSVGRRSKV